MNVNTQPYPLKPSATSHPEPLDPLRRVFVPVERPVKHGTVFQTSDKRIYMRLNDTGEISRAIRKVRGKSARRADKRQRRAKT